jgi:predicted GNAT family acetyltransferase
MRDSRAARRMPAATLPDFQGKGYARRLMMKLIRRQMLRNEMPFLHVMRDNTGAHGLYQRMGFKDYKESVVRVVSLQRAHADSTHTRYPV